MPQVSLVSLLTLVYLSPGFSVFVVSCYTSFGSHGFCSWFVFFWLICFRPWVLLLRGGQLFCCSLWFHCGFLFCQLHHGLLPAPLWLRRGGQLIPSGLQWLSMSESLKRSLNWFQNTVTFRYEISDWTESLKNNDSFRNSDTHRYKFCLWWSKNWEK